MTPSFFFLRKLYEKFIVENVKLHTENLQTTIVFFNLIVEKLYFQN